MLKRTTSILWRIGLLLLIGAALVALTFSRPPATSRITINYPSITGPTWPLYIAKDGGYYAKYGLDVNLVYGEHPAGIAMILNGEASMTNYGLEPAMQASSRDGSLVAYGSPFRKSLIALMVGKDIQRIRDLKGKRIAVSQVGAPAYTYALRMLATDGLTSRDVQWVSAGGGGNAPAAVLAGQRADAALVSAPAYFKLEAQGFKSLANISDFEEIYAPSVYLFTKSQVEENPALPELLIKAHAEAIKRLYEDKAFAVKTYIAYNKEDPVLVGKVYDRYIASNAYERVPYILEPAVRYMIDHPSDEQLGDQIKQFDFHTVLDNSIVDRLVKARFFEKLFGSGIKAEQEWKGKVAFR
jgi:ABC-type nitrate/sulfonate/bicarbonate transport system substrate-binding protein